MPFEVMSHPAYEVLVIDDDPMAIHLVSDALDGENFRVTGATDPELGLRLVEEHRPPIVILDLVMPKMGGMEVLERILEIAPEIDVILLNGSYSIESAVE